VSALDQRVKEKELAALRIGRSKQVIDNLLEEFCAEGPRPSAGRLWSLRTSLAAASLQNCSQLSEFVRKTSPALGDEIERSLGSVSSDLNEVRRSRDPERLENWFKSELAPLLHRSELDAYRVGAMSRCEEGSAEAFRWNIREPPGGEEHVNRFGKPADQFRYLDQTCPICGGRIDELGWCGCGNIGGG
jgi:hypothetical protein